MKDSHKSRTRLRLTLDESLLAKEWTTLGLAGCASLYSPLQQSSADESEALPQANAMPEGATNLRMKDIRHRPAKKEIESPD